jgi:DNA-binding transcriptional LysR family regulator
MELRQLKSLCLIAQYGTVKEAAKRSFLTSSAISLQIKMLEKELGIKVFERAGRRLVPTLKGEALYQGAQTILDYVREAVEKTVAETGEFTGKISLIAPACLRPLVLLQPSMTTRKIIDGAFRKEGLTLRIGMEASACAEIKRYVANHIGVGIIHNICIDPEDTSRFRSMNVESLFPHPEAKLIFRRSKTLLAGEKKLVDFLSPSGLLKKLRNASRASA